MPEQSTTPHFKALDGWRGVCACFLVLFHFHGYSPLFAWPLVRHSYLFVDFFFVLSGFVIAWNYESRLDSARAVRRFLILRLGRIYPLHVFMLLCFVAYEFAWLLWGPAAEYFSGGSKPSAILSNLLLIQSLHVHDSLTWNGPSWSISAEFWTYVIFALAAAWFGLRNWMLAAAAIVPPLLLLSLSATGMDVTYDWGLLRALCGFAVGVVCCRVHRQWRQRHLQASTSVMTMFEVLAVLAIGGFVSEAGRGNGSLLAPFVFGVAVLLFAAEGGQVSRFFRTPVLQWLGKVSYSIYLTHSFVVLLLPAGIEHALHRDLHTAMRLATGDYATVFGRNNLEGTLLYVAVFGVTLLFSAFTYRWIEAPGRDWSRRRAMRPQPKGEAFSPSASCR